MGLAWRGILERGKDETIKIPPVRNVSREAWEFLLEEQFRRKKADLPCRTGDLVSEALEAWRKTIDPLADIRSELRRA